MSIGARETSCCGCTNIIQILIKLLRFRLNSLAERLAPNAPTRVSTRTAAIAFAREDVHVASRSPDGVITETSESFRLGRSAAPSDLPMPS